MLVFNGGVVLVLVSSALPEHETVKRLATIATEYVVVKQGMCVEWGKHA